MIVRPTSDAVIDTSGWAESFKPVADPRRHDWRIRYSGPTGTRSVACDRCKMELVPCVDVVGLAPVAALYVRGRGERYDPRHHGRCSP